MAMIAADTDRLYALFATGFTWVHGSGKTDSRASMVRKFATGLLQVAAMTPADLRVEARGDCALVTGLVTIALVVDGQAKTSRNLFSALWISGADEPRLLNWQNTRAPEA